VSRRVVVARRGEWKGRAFYLREDVPKREGTTVGRSHMRNDRPADGLAAGTNVFGEYSEIQVDYKRGEHYVRMVR